MHSRDRVLLQIPNKPLLYIAPDHLPQVGTIIQLHKHHYDGATSLRLEITEQEWSLDNHEVTDEGTPELPRFSILLKTRVL